MSWIFPMIVGAGMLFGVGYSGATYGPQRQNLQSSLDTVKKSIEKYKTEYAQLATRLDVDYDNYMSQLTASVREIQFNQEKLNSVQRTFARKYRVVQIMGILSVISVLFYFIYHLVVR